MHACVVFQAPSDTGRKQGLEETSVHLGGLSVKLHNPSHLSASGSDKPYDLRKVSFCNLGLLRPVSIGLMYPLTVAFAYCILRK